MPDARDAAWLPSERVARVWQAFASNNPRTVIHFPMFEGRETYGGVSAHGWHNSSLAAGEPFELVASGPAGPGVTADYFDAGEPLKVLARHDGNPFRVTLEARAPGLHAIYAVTTTADGKQEISRPVTVFFQKRP